MLPQISAPLSLTRLLSNPTIFQIPLAIPKRSSALHPTTSLFCNPKSEACTRRRGGLHATLAPASFNTLQRTPWSLLYRNFRASCVSGQVCGGYSTRFEEMSSEMERKWKHRSLAQKLWEGCKKEAYFALYHPFVVALAAGTLKKESFQHYIAQDAFFLTAFVQAYGMAIENTDDEVAKEKLYQLQQAAHEELELHESYAKGWNVILTEYASPHPATMSYVRFLLSTAAGKNETQSPFTVDSIENVVDAGLIEIAKGLSTTKKRSLAAYTLAAMVPCMRLYAFLGEQISKSMNDYSSGPYGKWISTYSSAGFKASTLQIEELLNRLAMTLKDEELAIMERLFRQAMILEVAFFDAQPSYGACNVPFLKAIGGLSIPFILMSDFDSTCSIADSCPVLASLATTSVVKAEKQRGVAAGSLDDAVSDLNTKWETLTTDYIRGFTELFDHILSDIEVSGASRRLFEYDRVKLALSKFSQYEVEANSKVEKFEVLKNISMEDVKDAGKQMPLLLGCDHFFKRILNTYDGLDADVHIISVCWSQTFLDGCLSKGCITGVNTHCNELDSNGGKSSGNLIKRVQTALDKEGVFCKIMHDKHESLSGSCNGKAQFLNIYVGDSTTDLLCLLKADVGFVIGQNASLRRFALAFGIVLIPLYESLLEKEFTCQNKDKWRSGEGVLYTVSDWHEIESFLFGYHRQACEIVLT